MSQQGLPITLLPGSLPLNYCFTDFQSFYNTIIALTTASVSGTVNFFNYGSTEPDPADRNKPWLRLLNSGAPDKWYVYYGGAWVSPNPVAASGIERRFVEASLADVWTYDGGSGDNPTVVVPSGHVGAMWEEDTNYAARFPLGAGTLPSTTVVGVGDTGGEEKHVLVTAELPAHLHSLNDDAAQNKFGRYAEGGANENPWGSGGVSAYEGPFTFSTQNTGDDDGHNTMPPYRVGRWIKRTAREFYTI